MVVWGLMALLLEDNYSNLNELIEEYGHDIQHVVPDEYLTSLRLKGKIYEVPTLRTMAEVMGLICELIYLKSMESM